ncbi:hypothetical protein OV320_5558 [Actinobacteria bacterium OV320]|nr:hypothetical protein OV320_5558 [Actinobacteria bacterium OV320]
MTPSSPTQVCRSRFCEPRRFHVQLLTPVADPQWLQVDLGPVRQINRVTLGVNAATSDIFGCAASLAADPDMCAALDRHVATLPASR